jgi:hypothetical protein
MFFLCVPGLRNECLPILYEKEWDPRVISVHGKLSCPTAFLCQWLKGAGCCWLLPEPNSFEFLRFVLYLESTLRVQFIVMSRKTGIRGNAIFTLLYPSIRILIPPMQFQSPFDLYICFAERSCGVEQTVLKEMFAMYAGSKFLTNKNG